MLTVTSHPFARSIEAWVVTFEHLRNFAQSRSSLRPLPHCKAARALRHFHRLRQHQTGFLEFECFSVTPPPCSTPSPGAWVLTLKRLRIFAQPQPDLRPPHCEAGKGYATLPSASTASNRVSQIWGFLARQGLGVVGTFSFINRKRYKLVLQAEGGFRARVQFELCGLPTSNYYASALPRSTRRLPLFMELPR